MSIPQAHASDARNLENISSGSFPLSGWPQMSTLPDGGWRAGSVSILIHIELNPNHATAHQWYGEFLRNMGRPDESLSERKKAVEGDVFGSYDLNHRFGH